MPTDDIELVVVGDCTDQGQDSDELGCGNATFELWISRNIEGIDYIDVPIEFAVFLCEQGFHILIADHSFLSLENQNMIDFSIRSIFLKVLIVYL